jgi:hypothetical protein
VPVEVIDHPQKLRQASENVEAMNDHTAMQIEKASIYISVAWIGLMEKRMPTENKDMLK